MSAPETLASKNILLCVTGGIACYKAAALTSRMVQAGAVVTVAMTEAAQRFVTPLTFQSLTGRQVYTSLWDAADRYDPQHIALIDDADLVIIAPATANILGKMASGIADDLVSTLAMTALAATPILLAPAMNTRMWNNPIVGANVKKLTGLGVTTIGPNEGYLACGTVGQGRMAEPEEIFEAAAGILAG
jgi:phosphopantothenoylcysteine decarboxylase/phosphopantothenate--cysteine ligase